MRETNASGRDPSWAGRRQSSSGDAPYGIATLLRAIGESPGAIGRRRKR